MSKNPYTKKEKSLKYKGFALLYREFALPLMKFLVKRTGGDHQAAQEVFSRTVEAGLKGYYTFEHKSSYFTWICKIGLNKMADYYREIINQRSKIIAPLFEELAQIKDDKLSPEELLALKEVRLGVRECINLLPIEKRQLLHLRYWEDLSIKQIAARLNTTERSAEGKLYRAKLELKSVIGIKYPELI